MPKDESRLESWKEIAGYLNKDVSTVIRWEKERGMPVHRIPGQKRSGVYAWPSEVSAWLNNGGPERTGINGKTQAVPGQSPPAETAERRRAIWIGSSVSIALLAGAAGLLTSRPATGVPRLGNPVQLTSDGHEKGTLGASGAALYFASVGFAAETITRVDQGGRGPLRLSFTAKGPAILDVSADGSQVLVVDTDAPNGDFPLWVVPADGGPSRRLAGLQGSAAAWSPDGRRLAYATGRNLFLANADGTDSRKFIPLPYSAQGLTWSPDGKRLSLSLGEPPSVRTRLWEASIDNRTMRKLLPGWSSADDGEHLGRWTPRGDFFVFLAFHGGRYELWAIAERAGLPNWGPEEPFRVAATLNGVGEFAFSKDGRKLFAICGSPERGDLMRYDPKIQRFVSYPDPEGLSAGHVSFSRDGRQAAYVTHPDMNLWKMNADGSGRRMLTDHAALPQWSPDGRRIAFMSTSDDNLKPTKIAWFRPMEVPFRSRWDRESGREFRPGPQQPAGGPGREEQPGGERRLAGIAVAHHTGVPDVLAFVGLHRKAPD